MFKAPIPATRRYLLIPPAAVGLAVVALAVSELPAAAAGESVAVAQGSGQNTNIDTTFPTQLEVTVSGPGGDSGSVTFVTPAAGPGGTFSGPHAVNTGLTDVVPYTLPAGSMSNPNTSAVVGADPFTANSTSGSYQVSATATGAGGPANFALTNDGLSATGGTPQTTKVGSAFSDPLTAAVYAYGAPVAGAAVTFTAPVGGASAVFSTSNTNSVTVTTNSQGVATVGLTANDTAGTYSVSATTTAGGVVASPSWSLTNTSAGVASAVTVYSGSPQSAPVGTQFGAPLVAEVTDANGNAVGGATVTFSISPQGGAGASFATGGDNANETTNSSGLATSPPLTANDTAGSFTVSAAVSGVSAPASFALTNTAGGANTITAGLGANQSTPVGSAFPIPLSVTVTDANNNPVPGANVTFNAPARGASGTFAGSGVTASALTNSKGVAVAPTFSANATTGGYVVTATTVGASPPASFALVNQAGSSSGGLQVAAPIVGVATTPDGDGYWLVGSDGGVFTYGDARFLGSAGALHLAAPIVGIASTPDGGGYWLVGSDGGVFTYGDARFFGSAAGGTGGSDVTAMTANGASGYMLASADAHVRTYGAGP